MHARSAASNQRPRCSVKVHENGADPGPNPVVRAFEYLPVLLRVLATAAEEWRSREDLVSGSPMSPITGHCAIFIAGNHRQPRRWHGIESPECNAETAGGQETVGESSGRGT